MSNKKAFWSPDPMMTPYVTIHWTPSDIAIQYGLSNERSMELLEKISARLEERSIELGWDVIDSLITDVLIGEGYGTEEEES